MSEAMCEMLAWDNLFLFYFHFLPSSSSIIAATYRALMNEQKDAVHIE